MLIFLRLTFFFWLLASSYQKIISITPSVFGSRLLALPVRVGRDRLGYAAGVRHHRADLKPVLAGRYGAVAREAEPEVFDRDRRPTVVRSVDAVRAFFQQRESGDNLGHVLLADDYTVAVRRPRRESYPQRDDARVEPSGAGLLVLLVCCCACRDRQSHKADTDGDEAGGSNDALFHFHTNSPLSFDIRAPLFCPLLYSRYSRSKGGKLSIFLIFF